MNTLVRIYSNVISKEWDKCNLINRLKATMKVADKDEAKVIESLIDDLPDREDKIRGTQVACIIRAYTKDTVYYPSIVCEDILQSYYTFNGTFVYIKPFSGFPEGIDIQFYEYSIEYDYHTKDFLDDVYKDYALKNPLKGQEYLKQYSLEGLKAFCKVWGV